MSLPIPCQHCGTQVPFEEEDRGFEVYCPSCQRACLIPLVDEGPTTPPTRDSSLAPPAASQATPNAASGGQSRETYAEPGATSVFSPSGAAAIETAVAGEISCIACGEKNSYQVADYGGWIYCSRCGAEIRVGQSWQEASARTAMADTEAPDPAIRKARIRWIEDPRVLGSAACVVLVLAGAMLIPRQALTPLLAKVGFVSAAPRRSGNHGGKDAEPFDQKKLKPQMIEDLLRNPHPFEAIINALTWDEEMRKAGVSSDDPRMARLQDIPAEILGRRRAEMTTLVEQLDNAEDAGESLEQAITWQQVLRELQLEKADPLRRALTDVIPRLMEKADPITREQIENLLSKFQPAEALAEAEEMWLKLTARGVPETDSRMKRLKEVVDLLSRRLIGEEEKFREDHTQIVRSFNETLDTYRDAIAKEDFAAAKSADDRAEDQLQTSTSVLRPYAFRLLTLRATARRLQIKRQGAVAVRQAFDSVGEALGRAESLRNGNAAEHAEAVTFAARSAAEARLRVQSGKWTSAERAEFQARWDELDPRLRLARGVRAVLDAGRLHQIDDPAGCKREADRAFEILPGLPEEQVATWLKQVETWHKMPPAKKNARRSPLAEEIDLRDRLDETLEWLAIGDLTKLLELCLSIDRDSVSGAAASQARQLAVQNLFRAIELQLDRASSEGEELDHGERGRILTLVRKTLDGAADLKSDSRWTASDSRLRQTCEPEVREALGMARSRAAESNFSAAVVTLEPWIPLAPSPLADELKILVKQWRHEHEARADREAEQRQWQRIAQLKSNGRLEEMLGHLHLYLHRWPNSANAAAARLERDKLLAQLGARFDEHLSRLEASANQDEWGFVALQLDFLNACAVDPVRRDRAVALKKRLEDRRRDAMASFATLTPLELAMTNADTILRCRSAASGVLAVEPNHERAKELFAQATAKAQERARIVYQRIAPIYGGGPQDRKLMESVIAMDPEGEWGNKARLLMASR